jgi:hypothetical protein
MNRVRGRHNLDLVFHEGCIGFPSEVRFACARNLGNSRDIRANRDVWYRSARVKRDGVGLLRRNVENVIADLEMNGLGAITSRENNGLARRKVDPRRRALGGLDVRIGASINVAMVAVTLAEFVFESPLLREIDTPAGAVVSRTRLKFVAKRS